MSYLVEYIKEKGYIFVEITGELSIEILGAMAKEVAEIGKNTQCRTILNDLRNAKLTNKIFDIYSMPAAAQKSGVAPVFKRALIVGSRAEEFNFLETVFVNQGHLVKMFSTPEEAEAWLFSKE